MARRHDDGQRKQAEDSDRGEGLGGVVRQLGKQTRIDGVAAAVDHDRVAIGLAAGDEGGADLAGAAGLVLDDDRLPQRFRHPGRDQPPDHVRIAPGWVGDHERDRPARPGFLGQRRWCRGAKRGERDRSHRRAVESVGHDALPRSMGRRRSSRRRAHSIRAIYSRPPAASSIGGRCSRVAQWPVLPASNVRARFAARLRGSGGPTQDSRGALLADHDRRGIGVGRDHASA